MSDAKKVYSMGLRPSTMRRIDAAIARTGESRSAYIERAVNGFMDDQDVLTRFFTDPGLRRGVQAVFSNPEVVEAMGELGDGQLTQDEIERLAGMVGKGNKRKGKK